MTSLFVFSAGVNTNRPWSSSCSPHVTTYLSSLDRRVIFGWGQIHGGVNHSYTSEQETAVSFLPATDNGVVWMGNGCLCMRRDQETRDKGNCVVFLRWTRIDLPRGVTAVECSS